MKIFIGADHRGYRLKAYIIQFLEQCGYEVVDVGVHRPGVQCDYPKFSRAVALGVAKTKNARGVLVCMSGIGHTIAANKIAGIRAVLCYNRWSAYYSRLHNNANILVLSAKFVRRKDIHTILKTWFNTEFAGGRHARRLRQIREIEKEFCKPVR